MFLFSKKVPISEGKNPSDPGSALNVRCLLCLFVMLVPFPAASQSVTDPPPAEDVLCLVAPYRTATSPAQRMARALVDQINRLSAEFPTIVGSLNDLQPALCLDERKIGDRGYYDPLRNIIGLKADLVYHEKLAVLLHELRHLDQLARGYCPSTEFSMKETARATFAVEADAQAVAILISWAMKTDGNAGPWQAMMSWPNYADIQNRFETVMRKTNDPAQATAAAFAQWYTSSWRIETYYQASCSDYLDRLDKTKLLATDDLLPDDFLENLCKMPDGSDYFCIEP